MARIRSIKPEFWVDGKIRRLSDTTALFFISLWNHCDDSGFFPLDTLELSDKVARWRSQDIMRMLRALHQAGMVRLSSGHGVGIIVSWHHQKIDKPRPSKFKAEEIQWDALTDSTTSRDRSTQGLDRIGLDRIGKDIVTRPERKPKSPDETLSKILRQQTWESYRAAYSLRYGGDPIRNTKVNTQIKQFVERVGKDAPAIAEFYLSHTDQYYLRQTHAVGPLLANAEPLYTQWRVGAKITGTKARELEKDSENQVNPSVIAEVFRDAQKDVSEISYETRQLKVIGHD